MPPFLVCIHDATPAYARETRVMLRDLAPLVSDEMNGLDPEETRRTLERGQRVFTEVFGDPARGFLAPAWRQGHVRPCNIRRRGRRSARQG